MSLPILKSVQNGYFTKYALSDLGISSILEECLAFDALIGAIEFSLHNVSTWTGNNYRVLDNKPILPLFSRGPLQDLGLSGSKTGVGDSPKSAANLVTQSGIIPAQDVALVRSLFDQLKLNNGGG
jgi:hypothetical protein